VKRIASRFAGNKHWAEKRYAEYFDVAAGQEAPRWVGWTGLDGRASPLRLLLTGFECVSKLNAEYIRENMAALFSRNAND